MHIFCMVCKDADVVLLHMQYSFVGFFMLLKGLHVHNTLLNNITSL
jgi:hypothetical protein